jgi:YD repeat-containing protein
MAAMNRTVVCMRGRFLRTFSGAAVFALSQALSLSIAHAQIQSQCEQPLGSGTTYKCVLPSILPWMYYGGNCGSTDCATRNEFGFVRGPHDEGTLRASTANWLNASQPPGPAPNSPIYNCTDWNVPAPAGWRQLQFFALWPSQSWNDAAISILGTGSGSEVNVSATYWTQVPNSNPPVYTCSLTQYGNGYNPDRVRYLSCPAGYTGNTQQNPYSQYGPQDWWVPSTTFCYRQREDRCPCVGQPIRPSSQEKIERQVDYVGAGPDKLEFARFYSSHLSSSSIWNTFGSWIGSYQSQLNATYQQAAAGDTLIAYHSDGTTTVFASNNGWRLDGIDHDSVVTLSDGSGATTGYRYYRGDSNTIEVFDVNGVLQNTTSITGIARQLTYSTSSTPSSIAPGPGYLIQITSSLGRTLSLTWGSNGQVATLTDPAGYVYSYSYAGSSSYVASTSGTLPQNLTSVSYPDGHVRTYYYNETAYAGTPSGINILTGIGDEDGVRFETYTYDGLGRATNTVQAGGVSQYSVSNATPGTQATVTDPLGTQRTYLYTDVNGYTLSAGISQPAGAGSAATSSSIAYDPNGNVTIRTDFDGNRTCYANDQTRNLELARLEGVASGGSCPASLTGYVPTAGTAQRLIQTEWHPNWRLKSREAAPLKITTWVYNGQADPTNGGATVSCAPSTALLPDGSPIAVLCKKVEQATTDATGAAGFSATATGSARVWTYTHNQYGQVLTATAPRGNLATTDSNYAAATTTYVYYGATVAGTYTIGDLQQVTDALGHVTQYLQYDGNGRVLQQVDPNGTATTFTYFPRGWLESRTVTPPSSSTSRVTSYVYDGVGQIKTVNQSDGSQIDYTYDAAHRVTQITDSAGDSINYTLDAIGNRTLEQVKDPAANLARQVSRVYDALNRLQTVTGALQ